MSKRNKRRKDISIEAVFEDIESVDINKIIQIVDGSVEEPDYDKTVEYRKLPTQQATSVEDDLVWVTSVNRRANPIKYAGGTIVVPAVGKLKLRKNWIESTPIGVRIFES